MTEFIGSLSFKDWVSLLPSLNQFAVMASSSPRGVAVAGDIADEEASTAAAAAVGLREGAAAAPHRYGVVADLRPRVGE